jgi:hypothetical protein
MSLVGDAPGVALPGLAFTIVVQVSNPSAVTWPALAVTGPHLVTIAYRWEDEQGRALAERMAANRIPYDLAPGESAAASVVVLPEDPPGPRRLILGVSQDGAWFDGQLVVPMTVAARHGS